MSTAKGTVYIHRIRFWNTKAHAFRLLEGQQLILDLHDFTNVPTLNGAWWRTSALPDWIARDGNIVTIRPPKGIHGTTQYVQFIYNNLFSRTFTFTVTDSDLLWMAANGTTWTDSNGVAWGEKL